MVTPECILCISSPLPSNLSHFSSDSSCNRGFHSRWIFWTHPQWSQFLLLVHFSHPLHIFFIKFPINQLFISNTPTISSIYPSIFKVGVIVEPMLIISNASTASSRARCSLTLHKSVLFLLTSSPHPDTTSTLISIPIDTFENHRLRQVDIHTIPLPHSFSIQISLLFSCTQTQWHHCMEYTTLS